VVSTIAATSSGRISSAVARADSLTHGFRVSFAVLAGLALVGAFLTGIAFGPRRAAGAVDSPPDELAAFEEAA
jgi:hypothetical protein